MQQTSTIAAYVVTGMALLGITPRPSGSEVAEGACRAGATAANLNITLSDINGKPFPLSDYRGKVVLLDPARPASFPRPFLDTLPTSL